MDNSTTELKLNNPQSQPAPFLCSHASASVLERAVTFLELWNVVVSRVEGGFNLVDLLSRTASSETSKPLSVEAPVVPYQNIPSASVGCATSSDAQPPGVFLLPADTSSKLPVTISDPRSRRLWLRRPTYEGYPILVEEDIRAVSSENERPRLGDEFADGLWYHVSRDQDPAIVVPDSAKAIQRSILMLAHNASGIHAGVDATYAVIRRQFVWSTLRSDITDFVRDCHVCSMAKPRNSKPPLGTQQLSFAPFRWVGLDFAKMSPASADGHQYILVMIDIFSHHIHLVPSKDATCETVVQALLHYGALYMDPHAIWSDQGSHFTGAVVKQFCELKGTSQKLTVANVEFTRGIIEKAVGIVKSRILSVLMEYNEDRSQWHKVLPLVQATCNNLPSSSLRGYSPNDLIFGFSRLPLMLVREGRAFAVKDVSQAVLDHVRHLQHALSQVHLELVASRSAKQRTSLELPPLQVGDHVLIADQDVSSLAPKWSTLGIVKDKQDDWTYVVKEVLSGLEVVHHIAFLRLANNFRHKQDLSSWEKLFWSARAKHGISRISDFRCHANNLQCLIHWADGSKAPSWEAVSKWCKKLPEYFKAIHALGNLDEQAHAMLEAVLDKLKSS